MAFVITRSAASTAWKLAAAGMALGGLLAFAPAAQAKGCIKGAAVGGVAGHVAGKHGVLGAAAGCAVGHHEAAKKEKAQQQQATPAAAAAPAAGGDAGK
jgi:hypothetical protein